MEGLSVSLLTALKSRHYDQIPSDSFNKLIDKKLGEISASVRDARCLRLMGRLAWHTVAEIGTMPNAIGKSSLDAKRHQKDELKTTRLKSMAYAVGGNVVRGRQR
jgi:hypothetical protein